MPDPVVALIGRPNVGKSTLFNQLTRTRSALVASMPGLTRDRRYESVQLGDIRITLVDTAGFPGTSTSLGTAMAAQTWQAALAADLVIHLCDSRDGVTVDDFEITKKLRAANLSVLLVANKIDGLDPIRALPEFAELGVGYPLSISATRKRGLLTLKTHILERLTRSVQGIEPLPPKAPADIEPISASQLAPPVSAQQASFDGQEIKEEIAGNQPETPEQTADDGGQPSERLRVAMIGRPNTGKSTLINQVLKRDRVVVSEQAGTTHDAVFIPFVRAGRDYLLIDTAGIRRRRSIRPPEEGFSVMQSLSAIKQTQVVVLLIDATEGLVDQDLHLLGLALKAGRSVVLAVNKWDCTTEEGKAIVRAQIDRRLQFVGYVDVIMISALTGTGIKRLYDAVDRAGKSASGGLSTVELTRVLERQVEQHPPPFVPGRGRIKLRYAHLGGKEPPVIIIHGNQTNAVPTTYRRYLENGFRNAFGLHGTPVRVEFRANKNPYADRKNTLTPRQVSRRSRLMKHVRRKHKKS